MTRAVSKEVREKIVQAYDRGLGTAKEIAEIFDVTERSVRNYIYKARTTGDLTPDKPSGRPPLLTEENLAVISDIVKNQNDLTLEEYQKIFYEKTSIKIARSTMHKACTILNQRRKKRVFMLQSKKGKTLNNKEKIL